MIITYLSGTQTRTHTEVHAWQEWS